MSSNIKSLFKAYLVQLEVIVSKIPDELFSTALSDDMFSLEKNAKIAANFILRGYCPLLDVESVSFVREQSGKSALLNQIADTLAYLEAQRNVVPDNRQFIQEKAGFSEIHLCQSDFIFQYIILNYMFHMSMVYAIARSQGVELSKGDFDGLHSYPVGYSFVNSRQ